MKQIFVFIIFLTACIAAKAQVYQIRPEYGWQFKNLKVDSALLLPLDTMMRSNIPRVGTTVYNTADSAIYSWDGSKFAKQGRAGTGAILFRAVDTLRWSNDTLYYKYNNGLERPIKITDLPQQNIIGLPDSIAKRFDSTTAKTKFIQYNTPTFLTRQNDFSPFNYDTIQTVLLPSGTGFEGNMVGLGYDVVFDPATNLYTMLYAGWNGFGNQNIGTSDVGLATSKDMITWSKYVSNPVFTKSGVPGTFDSASVTFPQLLWDDVDSLWHMYYIGFPNLGFEKGQSKIGHATAKSLYGPWTRNTTPIFTAPSGWLSSTDYIFRPNVVKEKDVYYMFFNGGPYGNERIGVATSNSAYGPFTATSAPITPGKIAPWAIDSFASDPDVFKYKGKWYMTYWARASTDGGDIGVSWTTPEEFPYNWRPYANSIPLGTGLQTRSVMVMGKDQEPTLFYAYGDINLLYLRIAYNLPKRLPVLQTLNVNRITDANQQYRSYWNDTATAYPLIWTGSGNTGMPNNIQTGVGIALEKSDAANVPGIGSFRIVSTGDGSDSVNYYIKKAKAVSRTWTQWYTLWNSGQSSYSFNTSNSRAFNINITSGFATMDFRNAGARRFYMGYNTSTSIATIGVATGSSGSEVENAAINISSTGNIGINTTNLGRKFNLADTSTAIYTSSGSISQPVGIIGGIINTSTVNGSLAALGFSPTNSSGTGQTAYIGAASNNGGTGFSSDIVLGVRTAGATYAERMRIAFNGNMGVNTASPTSTLHIAGSFAANIATITGNTTLDGTYHTVLCNNTGANITVTLPAAATCAGRFYFIKKIASGAFTVTVQGNGAENIDGANTNVISAQWNSITIQSNGTQWYVL